MKGGEKGIGRYEDVGEGRMRRVRKIEMEDIMTVHVWNELGGSLLLEQESQQIKSMILIVFFLLFLLPASAIHVVIAGGTSRAGIKIVNTLLAPPTKIDPSRSPKPSFLKVTVLSRNVFLSSAPSRVTGEFGYLGRRYIEGFKPSLAMRDYDGGGEKGRRKGAERGDIITNNPYRPLSLSLC